MNVKHPTIGCTLGLFVMILLAQSGYAQHPCTEAEGRRALDEAAMLRSWDSLYTSYRSFRQCDDGAIAEGYSESVARILVAHWNTLSQFDRLGRRDIRFRRFVIRHLDATLDVDDVETVKRKSTAQCMASLRDLCADLSKQADAALKESGSP